MIDRRTFLALISAVPPVCKAMLANHAEWHRFARELSRALGLLSEKQFLILETKESYYVQFAAGGSLGMRAEAVSNGYLHFYGEKKLSEQACSRLIRLGWNAPTIIPDPVSDRRGYKGYGSPNFFLNLDVPVPYQCLANLAASTLRGVFGARNPGELRYTAFAKRGGNIQFPNLGIALIS
jgi:hypothetical protein